MRREHDAYMTPTSVATALVNHLPSWSGFVWEPCAGDGRFADLLTSAGFEVVRTDVQTGHDFFEFDAAVERTIITNPPFNRIREFIDHAFAIGVERMALVCPERLWACGKGMQQFERHRPSTWANLSWREDYLGKGGAPDRALAVAIWERPHSVRCSYEIWDRP